MRLPRLSPRWTPYVLLSPFVLLFAVFELYPLLFSLRLAFAEWEPTSGLHAMRFVGWANFRFALHDPWFWKSLRNTFWLAAASGLPQHLVAIPLAAFIHRAIGRGRHALVGAYFLPYITSTVAVAILFGALFSTDYGLINALLQRAFHLGPVDWMNDPLSLKVAIALLVFWRYLGFNVVLYLAAIQSIPTDLYEAAALDGAGRWQQFRHITLPGIRPMVFFAVTLSVIGGLQLFEEPYILTSGSGHAMGGPDQAGMTAALYLYRMAFDFDDFGGSSAMSWLMFVVVAALTWATNRFFRVKGSS